ncbi:MAG: energy-coupling factor ABC transporter permease [Chthoniobacterales bacterium]|nr:energy-coupling factor ABC transporter permease [Chthoniobacterales bacterium]
MHIPDGMMSGPVCPLTAIVSTVGVAGAAYSAVKSKERPEPIRFASVTALIFAAQMLNFPIQNGTSGHLLGGVLASSLLGVPFGILSLALVVTLQCLMFSDGGLTVLGANLLNMGLVGAGLGGLLNNFLKGGQKDLRSLTMTGISAWVSVVLAAFFLSLELWMAGVIPLAKVLPAMVGIHAMIGIGEAFLTIIAVYLISESPKVVAPITTSARTSLPYILIVAFLLAALLSPFASPWPDGLEWVAEKLEFLHESAPTFVAPLPDYSLPGISHQGVATAAAGVVGVAATFAVAFLLSTAWCRPAKTKAS